MKADIERAVAPLAGLPLWGHGRESNMLALQLGARRPAPTRAEPAREAGEYALHVFCAWRLTRAGAVLAGSADLFTPSDPDEDLESFDYDAPGATWWDVRWGAYAAAWGDAPPTVAAVAADAFGGLRLALSDGALLEVFPNSAPAEQFETEFWNLAAPDGGAVRGRDRGRERLAGA
jgi:hypothetical protein